MATGANNTRLQTDVTSFTFGVLIGVLLTLVFVFLFLWLASEGSNGLLKKQVEELRTENTIMQEIIDERNMAILELKLAHTDARLRMGTILTENERLLNEVAFLEEKLATSQGNEDVLDFFVNDLTEAGVATETPDSTVNDHSPTALGDDGVDTAIEEELAVYEEANAFLRKIGANHPLLHAGVGPGSVTLDVTDDGSAVLVSVLKRVENGEGPLWFYHAPLHTQYANFGTLNPGYDSMSHENAFVSVFVRYNQVVSAVVLRTYDDRHFQQGVWKIPVTALDLTNEKDVRIFKLLQEFIMLGQAQDTT